VTEKRKNDEKLWEFMIYCLIFATLPVAYRKKGLAVAFYMGYNVI
jgi:hypothetical protein